MQKINGIIIMSSGVVTILSPHKPWDNTGFWAFVSLLMGFELISITTAILQQNVLVNSQ